MKTLQEDIDDIDRMVDTGAQKDAIRSQIRLVSREVAALEADYARLAQAHAESQDAAAIAIAERDDTIAKLRDQKSKADHDAWNEMARRADELHHSKDLNYGA